MATRVKGVGACIAVAIVFLMLCLLQPSLSQKAKAGDLYETVESGDENQEEYQLAETAENFSAGMAAVMMEGNEVKAAAEEQAEMEAFSAGMAAVMMEGSEIKAEEEQQATAEMATQSQSVLVTADVDKAMNIRAEASEDASIVGKFYRGCVGELLDRNDGWYQIESGSVTGWVSADYVKTGEEAELLLEEIDPVVVTVETDTLNVRADDSTSANVLAIASQGQVFMAVETGDEWIEIIYTPDITGYVSADYVTTENKAGEALDMETLNELKESAAQKEEERAAQEKKQQIATTTGNSMAANTDDYTLLAALCQYEAGGNYDGALAVANVVLNRVRSSGYPNSIAEVIYASGQFGSVSSGALNKYLSGSGIGSSARRAASDALAGVNNIGDYTSFCSAGVANIGAYSSYTIVGGNCFYKK